MKTKQLKADITVVFRDWVYDRQIPSLKIGNMYTQVHLMDGKEYLTQSKEMDDKNLIFLN